MLKQHEHDGIPFNFLPNQPILQCDLQVVCLRVHACVFVWGVGQKKNFFFDALYVFFVVMYQHPLT